MEKRNILEQKQHGAQEELNVLQKRASVLKQEVKSHENTVSQSEGHDYYLAKREIDYEKYKIKRKYPDLVKLYDEPVVESPKPLSWFQNLVQKPQSWYRKYAQHVRQKEVKALENGESLSTLRTVIMPAFIPRLTEKEQVERRNELAQRLPMQGKHAVFETEQINLNPDKNIGKKAFDQVRTWYSNWRVTPKKIGLARIFHK